VEKSDIGVAPIPASDQYRLNIRKSSLLTQVLSRYSVTHHVTI